MNRFYLAALCLLVPVAISSTANAHIKMLKPTPWITTDALGNPQKQGPCGTANAGSAASGEVTTFTAGEEITVEWTETIDHPGHFRIALAKDRSEFEDPDLKPAAGTCDYPAGSVPTEPHGNVLLDNLFPTTGASTEKMYSQKVKLPNEPCEKCTLQLIQWMTKHAPSCLYYQCADIKIVAAGSGNTGGSSGGAAGRAAAGASGGSAGAAGKATAGAGGSTGSAGKAAAGSTAAGSSAEPDAGAQEDDAETESDGCSVRPNTRTDAWGFGFSAFVALALWSRRRRNRRPA